MRLTSRPALLATAYFALRSAALPRPALPSYSVVAVDGGQNPDPTPTTIIRTVTDSESPQTTVTIGAAPATTTLLTTLQPNTVTVQPEASPLSVHTVVVAGPGKSYTTTAISSQTTTVMDTEHTTVYKQGPTTTVLSMVTPSTSYFDDGMWHTSYGVPVWPTKHVMGTLRNQTTPCGTAQGTGCAALPTGDLVRKP